MTTENSSPQNAQQTEAKPEASIDASDFPKTLVPRVYILAFVGWGLWLLSKNDQIRTALGLWWIGIGFLAVVVLVGVFLPFTSRWLQRLSPTKRAAYVTFGLIPFIASLVYGSTLLKPTYQANALRIVFLLVVILFPASLYYLFLATRKASLLNEFISNLSRLGLLNPETKSSQEEQDRQYLTIRRRFESYMRKFEALYGPVSRQDLESAGIMALPETATSSKLSESDKTGGLFTSEMAVPVIIASVLIALGWILILPVKRGDAIISDWLKILGPEESPVYFAFLGAYFFSLQMLFRRYVLRDLRPSAYVAVAMRIVLAVIGVWVVTIANHYKWHMETSTLMVLAFVIGVFPSLAWQFVQSAMKKVTAAGFFIPSLKTELPISDLDGLTVWHEARFEEEDVENIPNMATADLVELMLQTRFPPDRIIDWVDQAMLYTHIGRQGTKTGERTVSQRLRDHGIRTATSLVETYRKARLAGDAEVFEKILPTQEHGRSPIRSLADALSTNPNFRTIWIWRGLPDEEYRNVTLPAPPTTIVTYRQPLTVDRPKIPSPTEMTSPK